jgi:acetyltransferase
MRVRYLAQPVRVHDGRAAWIREVRPDDGDALGAFIRGLSPSSRYLRFLVGMRGLSTEAIRRLTRPSADREAVLVATPGDSLGRIIGMAQYVIDPDGESCEFALVVGDDWQRRGLGSRLILELSGVAARHGVTRIHADVLTDNHAMRRLAEKNGWDLHTRPATPVVMELTGKLPEQLPQLERPTSPTTASTLQPRS